MRSKMMPFVVLAGVLVIFLAASSCGNGSAVCPTCGTDKKATIGLIAIMLVPEHNGNGEPGGPFNIFDISWADSVNHLYYVTDRIGLDVPIFNTRTDIANFAIGGDNSVAEAGNNVSRCLDVAKPQNPPDPVTIPPITSGQGNYTRFGCKTMNFALPGFGANGHFGGFLGGQCCASRANNLNPLTGPNGLELDPTGEFVFVGNGSSNVMVFDMTKTPTSFVGGGAGPVAIADLVSGTSPDYDGIAPPSGGISACEASANGRAFSDPTCGDLRGDELATTGATQATDALGNKHDLLMVINGDPGLPFTTIFDITGILRGTGSIQQQHCLPVNVNLPFSPGGQNNTPIGPNTTFTRNYSACVLGQIYYDNSNQNNMDAIVDDIGTNGPTGGVGVSSFPCPDPSVFFNTPFAGPNPQGLAFNAVPTGASGHAVGVTGKEIPCHHGPQLRNSPPGTPTNGTFCPTNTSFPDCFGAVALAGLGGMVFNPNTGHFLLTNANATTDITVGTVDEIDPFHSSAAITAAGFPQGVPVVINSLNVPGCMPSGIAMGPGTDALVTCAGHDGRQFAPTTYIINATTLTIIKTINEVGGVDQGWFNPGDGNYYLAARDLPTGPVLGVINARTRAWLQNVPTNGNAHSVAADAGFNKIYVPLPAGGNCQSQAIDGCVGVYASQ